MSNLPETPPNKFLVKSRQNEQHQPMVVIVNTSRLFPAITPDDALLLAAYLVAVAEPNAGQSFEQVFKAVKST